MKTSTLILALFLFSIISKAQVKQRFEAGTQSGYEYNYFKSPDEIQQGQIIFTAEDLIESSLYQDVTMAYHYRKKWRKNRIRFSTSGFARLFRKNFEDSYWNFLGSIKYDHNISRSVKLLGEVSVKRRNRRGLNGAQDVLINPLGFTNYGAKLGTEFRLLKRNRTTVSAFYNFKDFDAFGMRDLQFNELGVQLRTKQKFRINRLYHAYGLSVYVKKRLYDTFNASEIITDGKRDWSYAKATSYYELPLSKIVRIKPGFAYYVRIDNKDKRSGFRQFGPSIGVEFDTKKTTINTSFQYLTRNYTHLEARDSNGLINEKIRYNYADFTFDAVHQLGSGFFLTATVYSRIRETNYTDISARSFRGYRNQYAGIGIQWEL